MEDNMIIPNELKVGNFIYNVEVTNEPILHEGMLCHGICDSENQLIQLSSDLSEQNKERVFLHELLHSIQFDRSIDLGEECEYIIDEFAKGLHAVINDNIGVFNSVE
jgi:hypothetical protein